MFVAKNQVRMHDTDMAGILYFANQFRFAHDALEDFIESEGLSFNRVFHKEKFLFVIVHVEADYFAPLEVGDKLDVQVTIERLGNSSFNVSYHMLRDGVLVGTAKSTHVCLHKDTRTKIPIPDLLKERLVKHLVQP